MKKIKETEFPLLNRKEVVYEIDHARQATPRKELIKKQIADELKVDGDLIKVSKVSSNFGLTKIRVIAEIYNTKEDLQRLIKKTKKQKQEKKEEPKKQEEMKDGKEESKK